MTTSISAGGRLAERLFGPAGLSRWSKHIKPLFGPRKRSETSCDVLLPSRRADEFYAWYERAAGRYPLWVVPYRMKRPYPWISEEHAARIRNDLLLGWAIYAEPGAAAAIHFTKILERKTFELDGLKTLSSRNYYSPEQFWRVYNRRSCEAIKRRLDPSGVFPGLYEKCHGLTRAAAANDEDDDLRPSGEGLEGRISGIRPRSGALGAACTTESEWEPL
jgi:FAD/FMN-containing dehydrogenase